MIKFYGTKWCGDCFFALKTLQSQKVDFEWIDIDKDPSAEQFVKQTNHGYRSVPTIVFDDGSILVEPSRSELLRKLATLSEKEG
jgi:mycoredoxin